MPQENFDPDAPEWATRLLKLTEVAHIVDEHRATVYRKIDEEIYPATIQIAGSRRMLGWELWDRVKGFIAVRDSAA